MQPNINWRHGRRTTLAAALAASLTALAGCSGGDAGSGGTTAGASGNASAPKITKVTIGYNPTISLPQALLGVNEGEFKKRVPGVAFSGKVYAGGADVVEALRAGVVDIGYSGPFPPLKAFLKASDVVLLAGAAQGGTELMVSKTAPFKSVQDLKGKVIGVNTLGSTADAMVRFNLLNAGLNPDRDVRIVRIEPGEQAEALKGGEVAAVAAPAPWPSVVAINGNARPLLNWKQILDNGAYLTGVLFTTKKFAEANPDFIKQFVAAHRAITDELNKDRAKGDARVLAAWSKLTRKTLNPQAAKAAFATIRLTNEAPQKSFERDMDVALKVGFLRKKGDLSSFVYTAR